MMYERICTLCKKDNGCKRFLTDKYGYTNYSCDTYHVKFSLADEIITMHEEETQEKLLDLVTEHLVHKRYQNINGINNKTK